MADHLYDMQPFPLEKQPKDDLVPLMLPVVTVATTLPATTTLPCDITKKLCLHDVVIPSTTE